MIPTTSEARAPRYARYREAAAYAGCHENSLRNLIHDGKLTAYRIGRAVRIDLNQLDALMAGEASSTSTALAIAGARLAEAAPELTPSQIDRIVSALRPALAPVTP